MGCGVVGGLVGAYVPALVGKCKLPNPSKILNAARSGLSKVKSGASKIISKTKQVISKGKKYKSTIKKVMKRVATSAAKGGAESAIQSKMTNSNVKNGTISGMISGAMSGLGGTGFAVAGSAIGGFTNQKLDGNSWEKGSEYGMLAGVAQATLGKINIAASLPNSNSSLETLSNIVVGGTVGLTNQVIGFAKDFSVYSAWNLMIGAEKEER